ncbi:MAG TPA: hypothetical protein EYP30_00445 [Archaeoglobaceae archaeon]|nr:hypothetical protein [Archaeoglobaceae archaeon]
MTEISVLEMQKEMKRAVVQWQNYLQALTGKYIPLSEAVTFACVFAQKQLEEMLAGLNKNERAQVIEMLSGLGVANLEDLDTDLLGLDEYR